MYIDNIKFCYLVKLIDYTHIHWNKNIDKSIFYLDLVMTLPFREITIVFVPLFSQVSTEEIILLLVPLLRQLAPSRQMFLLSVPLLIQELLMQRFDCLLLSPLLLQSIKARLKREPPALTAEEMITASRNNWLGFVALTNALPIRHANRGR